MIKKLTVLSVFTLAIGLSRPQRALGETLLGGWTFDTTAGVGDTPPTPTVLPANLGLYLSSANLYADGTNGSSVWASNPANVQWNAQTGSTTNDPRETPLSGKSITPTSSGANGKQIVFKLPTSSYHDLSLTFATRGTSTGYTTHQWAYSTDGSSFTNIVGNTAETGTSYVLKSLNLPAGAEDSAVLYLRLNLSGATSTTGYSRLDNILISSDAFTWFGDTSSSFTTTANWIAPGLSATYSTAPVNASSTRINFRGAPAFGPSIAGATTSGTILFNDDAVALDVAGAGTWIVHGGFNNRSANTQTISPPVVLGANQSWQANAANLIFNGGISDNGRTLTIGGDHTIILNGSLGGGAGSLVKTGIGALIMGGASNTYGGATSISSGMLILNGGLGPGALVSVTGSGTLSGTGTIGRNLTIGEGGTVSPGNGSGSIGSLTVGASTSTIFLGGGTYAWEIAGTSPGQADSMTVDALTISATSATPITLKIISLTSLSGLLGNHEYRWPLASANSVAGFDPLKFALNIGNFSADVAGSWAVEKTNNTVELVYTTVPDPAGGALILLSTMALTLHRRRGSNAPSW